LSRALRMAATWPSIMAEGATMSAPARAWLRAIRPSSRTVGSLSTAPSSFRRPQWPWSVYSHMQTSVVRWISLPYFSFSSLRPCCTGWSSAQADVPRGSFREGRPKSRKDRIPASRAASAASCRRSGEMWSTPCREGTGFRTPVPGTVKRGRIICLGSRETSRTISASTGCSRRRRILFVNPFILFPP